MFSVVALTRIYMLAYVSNTKQSPAIIALRIRRISEVFLFVCNKIKKTLYVNKIRNVRVISLTGVIAVFFLSFFGRIFFDNSSFSKLFESPRVLVMNVVRTDRITRTAVGRKAVRHSSARDAGLLTTSCIIIVLHDTASYGK